MKSGSSPPPPPLLHLLPWLSAIPTHVRVIVSGAAGSSPTHPPQRHTKGHETGGPQAPLCKFFGTITSEHKFTPVSTAVPKSLILATAQMWCAVIHFSCRRAKCQVLIHRHFVFPQVRGYNPISFALCLLGSRVVLILAPQIWHYVVQIAFGIHVTDHRSIHVRLVSFVGVHLHITG